MSKKCVFALVLIAALYCALPCSVGANAAEYSWARITQENVYLFADEACDKMMFKLEKSYYVEILDVLDKTYQVAVMQSGGSFPTVMGYVRKIEATPCEIAPLSPVYPTERIYVTTDSAQLKLLPVASSETVIAATTTQYLSYYGSISYYGRDWYYVYCAGKFGYVDVSNVSKPNVQPHPTPLESELPVIKPQEPSEPAEPNENENKNGMPTAEILLIVFVVLLASGLTLAIFLPGNGKKNEVFEQDI